MDQIAALHRQIAALRANQEKQAAALAELVRRPRNVMEEIDAIPGRRINFTLSGQMTNGFTTSQDGQKGAPISMQVSQDGSFVWTHYPIVTWWPNLPTNATNFQRVQPVQSTPLPTQSMANLDFIDILYEVEDAGSNRKFQSNPVSGHTLSRPDHWVPLPVPTIFAPAAQILFTVTFLNIAFSAATATPTTGGMLQVDFPGFRIVNL